MIQERLSRRSVLLGAGATVAGVAALNGTADAAACDPDRPLWKVARDRGLVFGSAQSTRLFDDAAYVRLVDRQAQILFTEDDLLWYQLKPTPDSELDFSYATASCGTPARTTSRSSARIWSGTRGSATAGAKRTCGGWTPRRHGT